MGRGWLDTRTEHEIPYKLKECVERRPQMWWVGPFVTLGARGAINLLD